MKQILRRMARLPGLLFLLLATGPAQAQYQLSGGAFNDLSPAVPRGLNVQFFNNTSLTPPAVLSRRDGPLTFSWPGSPGAGVNADFFSARWEGFIRIPASGDYTFYVTSDDGVRLWIQNLTTPAVDQWVDRPPTENATGTYNLIAGAEVPVKIEFYEGAVGAVMHLAWSGPGIPKGIIPASALLPVAGGGDPVGAPVTFPAIAGQDQGPNKQSMAATSATSGPRSTNAQLMLQYPSQIYRDGSGQPTGQAVVMLQSEAGYTFASGVPRFYMGDVVHPPLARADGSPVPDNYWRIMPVKPGEVISHTSGGPETPLPANAALSYYYSPHAKRVFATQPGLVTIKWVSRLPESGRYQFRDETFGVSASTRVPVKHMYWTERNFTAPAVNIPAGRINSVNPVYSSVFPAALDSEYLAPGTVRNAGPDSLPEEKRTLWVTANGPSRTLRAYNHEGRIFVEYLGALVGDGVYEFLGADVVEVGQTAPPATVTVKLGEQVLPEDADISLLASPALLTLNNPAFGTTARPDGRFNYYAEHENQDPDKVQFYWLEARDAGIYDTAPGLSLEWVKYLNKYRFVWPADAVDYAQLVVPNGGSTPATGVAFGGGGVPEIIWQDDSSLTESSVDLNSQRLIVRPGDGNNRSLLKFVSGNDVWYVRVNSQTETGVQSGNGDGTSFTATATVGQRIERPSAEYEVGGYIAGGTGYSVSAWRNPYSIGVEASGTGAVIPVNAIPGNDQLTVWWFKKIAPPNSSFSAFYIASRVGRYSLVYPAGPQKIIMASNDGSGDLGPSELAGSLYVQNDRTQPGFNPNEEHSVFIAGRIYALRDDLNVITGTAYTSQPYALLSYINAADQRPSMHVWKIEREDATHPFDYPVTAGTILGGPMPLPVLAPARDANGEVKNTEVTPAGIDPRPNAGAPVAYDQFTFEDRKGHHWVYRGPHAGTGNQRLEFKFYYPMQAGFFIPALAVQPAAGTALPYLRPLDGGNQPVGDPVTGAALTIKYRPVWPVCPELRVAETLTLPKFGLPSVRGQTSAEILYQQSVARLGTAKPAAILHDPTRQKVIALDAPGVGLSKLPASAATTGALGRIYFQFVPPHLQSRFYYDALLGPKGSLVLKGGFVNEIAGEDYLNLNVLTATEVTRLKDIVLSDDADRQKWNSAIDALTTQVETFIENPSRAGTYIVGSSATVTGTDSAVISDSDTAVDSYALTATGKGDGYVTLLFGDGDAFTPAGEPVSVKVIKVAPQLYTGELKVIQSGNPLDEQVALRHSGDFAAHPEDYEFEWYRLPPDGTTPATYRYDMAMQFGSPSQAQPDGRANNWTLTRNPVANTGAPPSPTRIVKVTGAGSGGGLDLSGTFVYAVNIGTAGAAGQAGDANFTADDAPGVTVSAQNEIPNWTNPDFGSTAADNVLEKVLQSIRWSLSNSPLTVNLANLTPGTRYKLQLLFGDNSGLRAFDVNVEGSLIADDFHPTVAQGGPIGVSNAGCSIVHEFTAGDATLNIVLDGANVLPEPGLDQNPILHGLTLEALPAGNTIPLPRSLVIRDGSWNPASGLPGVVLTNAAPVDFTAGVPQQLVFSATLPALDGFVLYVNGTPALASNAPAGFENTGGTSGLSPTGLPQQWSLNPGFFTAGPNQIEIALYTGADANASSFLDFRFESSQETDLVLGGGHWMQVTGSRPLTNVEIIGGDASSPLGSPLLAMSDNYFTMRYRAKAGTSNVAGTQWSRWMPAKLVEGWIKRVLAGINPFNQRVSDLLNNPVNTDVSLLTQAGSRWEGDVALNLQNINDSGLIEIYETVLKRGRSMSIESGYDYGPANDALLLAAGYLNDLYNILGNEAYADAANPTISIDDQTTITEVNTSRFAFEGQVTSVLDEELALLRGRDDFLNPGIATAPAYNRLYWNYTRGINSGEALYAVNYNIKEKAGSPTANGILDAADAQRMFPQGHGDAYGHYLTALKGYYYLLTNPKFSWVPRSEAVTVLGQAVQIDYSDERKFARAAASLARTAEQIQGLTHRQNYKDNTPGWQQFRDGKNNPNTGVIRQAGLDEWTARSTQGALFHWVVGNAVLPEKDTNPNHTGVQIIDRTTVPELNELVSAAARLQNTIDNANARLNPLGLSPDSIAFDISPSQLQDGHTHFEQVYERALKAVLNARGSFDQAAKMTRLLRNQENQIDDYNAAIVEEERSYVSQLKDIFGTPYSGDIGPGKTYAQDYIGPDLVNWFVVDRPTDMVDTTEPVDIIVNVPANVRGFTGSSITDVREAMTSETVEKTLTVQPNRFIQYADTYTASLGQRTQTGRLQQALLDAHAAQLDLLEAGSSLGTLQMRFEREHQLFNEMVSDHLASVTRTQATVTKIEAAQTLIANLNNAAAALLIGADNARDVGDGIAEILPENYGLSFSAGAPIKGLAKLVGALIANGLAKRATDKDKDARQQELNIATLEHQLEAALDELGFAPEKRQAIYEYELLFDELTGANFTMARLGLNYQRANEQVLNVLSEGSSILNRREVFRQRAAAIVQGYRTRDLTFRTFRNEALEQYRTLFDLAGRYTYLAAKSYDYETGLLGSPQGSAAISSIVNSRSLGDLTGGIPQATTSTLGDSGLAGVMARLQSDWSVAKGRLGINNPDAYGTLFSLRGEKFRILNNSALTRDDEEWRQTLEHHIVPDVMTDADVGRYCANIRKPDGSAVPGIVLPFSTSIGHGQNFFGLPLAGGDHAYSASSFATKIYSMGMCFPGYVGMDATASGSPIGGAPNVNSPLALSATPYVYLIPCGEDSMLAPAFGDTGEVRSWKVNDQALPLPFNLGATSFSTTQFFTAQGTLTEQPWIVRKHQAFRVVSDAGLFYSRMPDEFTCRRLVGRSAWNSQWKLVIPAYTLLANEREGLNRFVASVMDIQLYLKTYSHAGN